MFNIKYYYLNKYLIFDDFWMNSWIKVCKTFLLICDYLYWFVLALVKFLWVSKISGTSK